jgi:hypothetical protein
VRPNVTDALDEGNPLCCGKMKEVLVGHARLVWSRVDAKNCVHIAPVVSCDLVSHPKKPLRKGCESLVAAAPRSYDWKAVEVEDAHRPLSAE